MAYFTRHEQCPRCRSDGNDRAGNNLGVYSDGSVYCFKCGYYIPSSNSKKAFEIIRENRNNSNEKSIYIPEDSISTLPKLASDYLNKYEITQHDIDNNCILWSESWSRIIFPYFTDDMNLFAWQGRYIGQEKKSKWFSQGNLQSNIVVVGNQKSNVCILVEDIISAIKVGHLAKYAVSPLFGSHLSTERLLQLHTFYDTLIIWMDPDMKLKSSAYAKQARELGFDLHVIFSDKDPKEYSDAEIEVYLKKHTEMS